MGGAAGTGRASVRCRQQFCVTCGVVKGPVVVDGEEVGSAARVHPGERWMLLGEWQDRVAQS